MNKLPNILFNLTDLEPVLSGEIMDFHINKHHQAYINNLNKTMASYSQYSTLTARELILNIDDLPEEIRVPVRNNAGGHLNHTLFWEILTPQKVNKISEDFLKSIQNEFMSMENMKEWLLSVASKFFGSGWAWLVVKPNKKLQIYTTPNQNSPLENKDIPILGIDLWEHSYYLQYKNDRSTYLERVWGILNWTKISELYAEAIEEIL